MQAALLNSDAWAKTCVWHMQQLPTWASSIRNVSGVFQLSLPVQFSSLRWGEPVRTFLGCPASKTTLALSLGTTDIDDTRMHSFCFIPCSENGKCIFSTSKSELQFQGVLVVLGKTRDSCFLGRQKRKYNMKKIHWYKKNKGKNPPSSAHRENDLDFWNRSSPRH